MLHYKARCQLVRVTSVPVHVHQFFFFYILVILRFAMRIKFLFVGCGGWICWFWGLLGFERLELKKGGLKGCDIMDMGCNFYPYSWTHLITRLIWISLNPTHLNIWIKWVKTYYQYILRKFRKLVIVFFIVKNTPKLINQQFKNWVKIVNWKKKVIYFFLL